MVSYINHLRLSIDHALAVSYRRNMYDGKTAFVAQITLVKGVPFYGYHVGYAFFLKIYMFNPIHMPRLADLLRQGAILKTVLQPYESHMQYLAQWMCDFNLYGCAYIDCSEVKFRSPIPNYLDLSSTTHRWHDRTIDPSSISDMDNLPRQSHCSVEVDVSVQHIQNRLDVKSRPIHHDFIERHTIFTFDEKLVQSMAGLWRDETRRRKARIGETDTGSSPFPPEVLVSVSANPRDSQPGGWVHEMEYADRMKLLIEDEKSKNHDKMIGFEDLVTKAPFEQEVNTSLESVEDLFPENLARIVLSQQHSDQSVKSQDAGHIIEAPDVDESRLLSYQENEFPYESDEELARELELSQRKRGDNVDERLEQFAYEGLDKPVYDDEGKLNSQRHSNTAATESDQAASLKEPYQPNSCIKLEALGIRVPGKYDLIEDDSFEIPIDYAGEIRAEKPHGLVTTVSKHKKKKSSHARSLGDQNLAEFAPNNPCLVQEFSTCDPLKSRDKRDLENYQICAAMQSTEPYLPHSDTIRKRFQTLPSSQDKASGMIRKNILSFPIVKDPQDPNTILKLSQNGRSRRKNSQHGNTNPVPFASSSAPESCLSNESKFLSWPSDVAPKTSSEVLLCSTQLHQAFDIPEKVEVLCFPYGPPLASDFASELRHGRLPSAIYMDAHYSNEKDVPDRPREYAGKEFKFESTTVAYLPDFDSTGTSPASFGQRPKVVMDKLVAENGFIKRRKNCALRSWEIEASPPTKLEVQIWLDGVREEILDSLVQSRSNGDDTTKVVSSQIDGPTQRHRHGFKYSQKQKSTSVQHETQYMSLMSLEIHVNTRGNLVPNPEQDQIEAVFWCLQSDDEDLEVNSINEGMHVGILILSEIEGLAHKFSQHTTVDVEEELSELDLMTRMVDIVRGYDPDILTGYEVHGGSWGYMIERARCKYDYDLCDEFSRTKSQSHGRFGKEDDRWGFNHTSTIRVTGRHMINIWRAMRGELNLLQYTMENVVFQLCHRRIPHYSFRDLSSWYDSGKPNDMAKVVDHYISRVQLNLEILEQNEFVPRTSEQARLLGVDFFSVFSRGSQFKVESLMFRIAKPENFLLPSPSRKQIGQQNALECLPLVMEPQSAFYNSPLLVLDFQSLYPSVMIAYNYCYSTFLGRVVNWRGQNKMGFTNYERAPRLLELLQDHINIAPNGIMYAKPSIRKSLLAKMLGEILETRVMVKSGMKVDKDDKTLQRLLNNRQLALKLIANVTYGYTSASFSGRMPCSEIADSIVQTGRETLEKAIALIHSVERWGAEVVYGDTDSLFVYLKGRTKDEAFDIGQEIAIAITNMNPRPVKLKFEKVYFPCVLLAKKRYVGFKYESKTQKVPEFDAKGIETVRRDGTPAEQKIEEKALKILFRTADLSSVKKYFQSQCSKIMKGKVSIQDFCFAKEVKLGTYSDKGPPPPGALISTRRMLEDPRAEPQYGERVPYVVITGAPGARLIDRCVAPNVLLQNDSNELDSEYYISKNLIPPLERIFNLVGANVRQWYDEMPKNQRVRPIESSSLSGGKDIMISKKTLESYMKSSICLVCHEKLEEESAICIKCVQHADNSFLVLRARLNRAEKKAIHLEKVCRSCAGLAWSEEVRCESKDCPVFYTRTRHMAELRSTQMMASPVMSVLKDCETGDFHW